MEFLIGNVGRDAGTLTFNGKFENSDLITGEVEFSPPSGSVPRDTARSKPFGKENRREPRIPRIGLTEHSADESRWIGLPRRDHRAPAANTAARRHSNALMSRGGDRSPARTSRLAAVHALQLRPVASRNSNSIVTIAEARHYFYKSPRRISRRAVGIPRALNPQSVKINIDLCVDS